MAERVRMKARATVPGCPDDGNGPMHPLGVHSHLFRGSPAAVAAAVRRHGLSCVQLSPGFPGLAFHDPGHITAERCRQVGQALRDAGVRVVGVSAGVHLAEPDLDRRHRGILRWHQLICHCREFGTFFVVAETGGVEAAGAEAGWAELCIILEEALRLAAEYGVTLLLKPGGSHLLATAADAVRLRGEVAHPNLGFVMDAATFALGCPPDEIDTHLAWVCARLGPCSPVVHAKDLRHEPQGVTLPRVGRGVLDYGRFLKLMRTYQPAAPVILEHLRTDELAEAKSYLERALKP
jgi:sugar phosphate isomerase/epimerase